MNHIQEQLFLENYDSKEFEKPSIAVDVLVFTIDNDELKILLIRREEFPYKEWLALPGTFVGIEETLEEAAYRGIREKTGLENIYIEQLYTWGSIKRDPRMRIISVSYLALVSLAELCKAVDNIDIKEQLYSVEDILSGKEELAFDHKQIVSYGRERLRNKVEYTDIAFELLPNEFTLPQLQKIFEILLGRELYKANFRKKIKEMVQETQEYTSGESHRPSRIWKRNKEE